MNLRLRNDDRGEDGKKVVSEEISIMGVTSKVSGEDVGRIYLGVLLGCLWGKEGEAVMSRESQLLYPPHSCRHTLSWSPQASATSLTCPKFNAQRREKGSGRDGFCLSPSPYQAGTK